MAYLNKEQYEKRAENAAKKMAKNAKNMTLTIEQHEGLSYLCTARHELHSNIVSATKCMDNTYKQNIVTANVKIHESGLETMTFVGTDMSDYIDIDAIDEAMEYECVSVDDDNYQEWYDDTYTRIYSELEKLNTNIEKYLVEIDTKYGTNYCPTGALRIM